LLTIIASMERELSGLRREISSVPSGSDLRLAVVGIGKSRSQAGVLEILNAGLGGPPRQLLMLGFAGAVDQNLKTGDLVLSSRYYVESPSEDFLTPDTVMRQDGMLAAANAGLPVHHSDSLTVDGIVSTPAAKIALAQEHRVGIVEMEDYWLAAAAQEARVPFISARAVLDTAQQSLPSYLPGLSQGRAGDVLKAVASPWRVPALVGLAYQARIARQTLFRFAASFIRQWESEGSALAVAR
jgi:nucleoside phosphorylase